MDDVRQLALVPLRDVVLSPGTELPIYVGREATIRAIKFAKAKYDGYVAVFSQINAETNGPISANDLYQVGTIAKIAASIEMTDQSIKGMLEGTERIRLKSFDVVGGVPMVSVMALPVINEIGAVSAVDQTEILTLLTAWCPDFTQACERAELDTIRTSRDLIPVVNSLSALVATPKIDSPNFKRDWSLPTPPRYRELLNAGIARRQKALEEDSYKLKIKMLIESIKYDLECRLDK